MTDPDEVGPPAPTQPSPPPAGQPLPAPSGQSSPSLAGQSSPAELPSPPSPGEPSLPSLAGQASPSPAGQSSPGEPSLLSLAGQPSPPPAGQPSPSPAGQSSPAESSLPSLAEQPSPPPAGQSSPAGTSSSSLGPHSASAPQLPPRTRGVIALLEANCTVCMICARECPDWCIHIDSHTETVQQEGAARPRQQNVLDRFAIDYGQCLYCGICVEVCPFDALHWAPEHDYPGTGEHAVAELVHERADLGKWVADVPPPPPLDAAAEAAPEAAPGRPARGAPGTGTRPGALSGRTRRPGG